MGRGWKGVTFYRIVRIMAASIVSVFSFVTLQVSLCSPPRRFSLEHTFWLDWYSGKLFALESRVRSPTLPKWGMVLDQFLRVSRRKTWFFVLS